MLNNNLIALILTFAASIIWLRLIDFIAHRGLIDASTSRKIIHIGTGPIFVACWLLFTEDWYTRYIAALVPLLITIQFVLVGFGIIKDQAAVEAMSRTGDRREILRGPLYYGVVFVLLTVIFWDSTPNGIVALMVMCGGDGLADIVGKKYPIAKIPLSPRKSMGGSLAVLAGGWLFSIGIIALYNLAGKFSGHLTNYLSGITIISAVATLVEALPFRDIDNITVPVASIILGIFLF